MSTGKAAVRGSEFEYAFEPFSVTLLELELKRFQAARRDLEQYLTMEPEAADRPEILKQMQAIHAWLARVN